MDQVLCHLEPDEATADDFMAGAASPARTVAEIIHVLHRAQGQSPT